MTARRPGRPSTATVLDVACVLGLAVYSGAGALAPLPGESGTVTGWWPAAVASAAALLLIGRRHAPTAVLVGVLSLCLYAGVAEHQMGSTPVAVLVACHAVGRWSERSRALVALGITTAVLAVVAGAGTAGLSGEAATWGLPLVFAVPWALGWWGRTQEERHTRELARAADDERMRIARELHDVVTHGLTGIAVRAGVARHLGEGQDEALVEVERSARTALVDLRRMVTLLRDPDGGGPAWEPVPQSDEVRGLVAEHTRLHGPVDLVLTPAFDDLPASLRLAVHRIVQECLTNVARHAGGARARVGVHVDGDGVLLEVQDDGLSSSIGPPGHGLSGMRERALAFDGTLTAGAGPHGGYEVRARLPGGSS